MLPKINPVQEKNKIVNFIKSTLKKQSLAKVVIGLSGGVDSSTSYYLLKEALPKKNILVVSLPYFHNTSGVLGSVISIKKIVDTICRKLNIDFQKDKIRVGNIMARVRMIILFDLAKKHNALVCGTENKTEHLLGYFTRFGDEASDIEPIRHLYKTQVYQLAKYLGVPKEIINQRPTAGLWSDQTDEGEFGFTYEETDQVLHLVYDREVDVKKVIKMGFKNAQKIIDFAKKNHFKHQAPYII